MLFHLVGKEFINYKSRKTSKQVVGVKLHFCNPVDSENIEGCVCDNAYVSESNVHYEDICELPINSDVDVTYNRYAGVDNVVLYKKK